MNLLIYAPAYERIRDRMPAGVTPLLIHPDETLTLNGRKIDGANLQCRKRGYLRRSQPADLGCGQTGDSRGRQDRDLGSRQHGDLIGAQCLELRAREHHELRSL